MKFDFIAGEDIS